MCRTVFVFYCFLAANYKWAQTKPLTESKANINDPTSFGHENSSLSDFKYDGRIVGGQMTSIFRYPFQVSLQYHKAHICGASILKPNIILTAAHCIEDPEDVASFQVRAGSTTHMYGGQVVGVQRIIKHEAYNLSELDSDVALVLLSKNLTFSRRIRPIELPEYGSAIPENKPLFVSGWGLTSETGAVSHFLNHVAVGLMNGSICEESYHYVATITAQMFCAGLPEGGKDSCQGDSGGPLVIYVPTEASPLSLTPKARGGGQSWHPITKPIQYGIVSFGVGCAQKGYPGVYANVAALRPWIDEKIKQMTNSN